MYHLSLLLSNEHIRLSLLKRRLVFPNRKRLIAIYTSRSTPYSPLLPSLSTSSPWDDTLILALNPSLAKKGEASKTKGGERKHTQGGALHDADNWEVS
jgi:hypothetical protein